MSKNNSSNPIYISSETENSDSSDAVFIGVNPNPTRRSGYCKICEENLMDLMFFPCHHASICQECFEKLPEPKKCPCCGAIITKRVVFYLS